MSYSDTVAFVAASINDPETQIDDPRNGAYKVSFSVVNGTAAVELARHLATLGIYPRTLLIHGDQGVVEEIRTCLYGKTEQRELLEHTEALLSNERRRALSDLVRARGPIPEEILEKIVVSASAGRTATQIASRMTELDVIDGMGGRRWTAQKINKVLARHRAEQTVRRRYSDF